MNLESYKKLITTDFKCIDLDNCVFMLAFNNKLKSVLIIIFYNLLYITDI